MTKIKKIITAAIAALALTTASLAIPGQAFAGGHGHGGHGGHGGTAARPSRASRDHGHGHGHYLGMVIITAIAIISSLITAAGNGAPTARSMSATAIIDSRRRKEARPGREARASFRFHDDHRDRLPGHGNQSRCKLIGLPDRAAHLLELRSCRPIAAPTAAVICGSALCQFSGRCPILTRPDQDPAGPRSPRFDASLSLNVCSVSATSLNAFALASRSMRVERNRQRKPEFRRRQAGYVMGRTFVGAQVG